MSKVAGDPSTPQYWDRRVAAIPDKKDMLFLDGRREQFWLRVRKQLEQWRFDKVLDVCCGYGQFADIFAEKGDWHGVDFSAEMMRLWGEAEPRVPGNYTLADVRNTFLTGENEYDIIFEVNSLRSLGWTPEQFRDKFLPHAKQAVACLEADQFTIFQKYG